MQIEQQEEKFQPVTIILQTEKEVALLRAALGRTIGSHEDDMLGKIYRALERVSRYGQHYKSDSDDITIREV